VKTYFLESNKDYHDKHLIENDEADNEKLLLDTIEYYENCHNDYLFAWCNRHNLALHYGYWNEKTPYNHHQALLNTNQLLYDTAAIQPGEKILDAGCGLGGSSIWVASEHQNKVTGITISEKQANYASHYAKRRNVEHLADFKIADYCKTPFEDESFDIVWALESSCYALNKADFLKEAYRLLRKGGRLVLCDAFLLQRQFNEQQWKIVMDFLNGWKVPNLSDRQEFTDLLEKTGFEQTKVNDISQQILPSSKHMYKTTRRLYPVQKLSQWLRLRSQTQTANYQVGFAQYHFFHDKLAEYCVFTATKAAGNK